MATASRGVKPNTRRLHGVIRQSFEDLFSRFISWPGASPPHRLTALLAVSRVSAAVSRAPGYKATFCIVFFSHRRISCCLRRRVRCGGHGSTTAPRRAVGAHLFTHSPFFFLLTLLSASSSKCARLLLLPPFLPLLFPSLLTLRQVALEALPLARLPSVSFLFKKKSDSASKRIAHRNKHRATRLAQHGSRNTARATRIAQHA
jgi:hypothetical protein